MATCPGNKPMHERIYACGYVSKMSETKGKGIKCIANGRNNMSSPKNQTTTDNVHVLFAQNHNVNANVQRQKIRYLYLGLRTMS